MDAEKVKYSIERCISHVPDACRDCAYDAGHPYNECVEMMLNDALVLLKEHGAVEPIPPTDESDLWKCGNCNHQLFRCTHQRYCEMCGKPVKWE